MKKLNQMNSEVIRDFANLKSKQQFFLPRSTDSRKRAFTLAEVLITLGIIGVVAALTLPNLIAEYKKHVYVAQLQKAVSVLEQGFQKMKADDGVDKLSETQVWASMERDAVDENTQSNPIFENLKKYYMVTRSKSKITYKYNILNDNINTITIMSYPLLFNDGFIINRSTLYKSPNEMSNDECNKIKDFGGSMCFRLGFFYIDVNGYKKPNTLGRDVFVFYLSDEGKLYPYGGRDDTLYNSQKSLDTNNYYWRNAIGNCGTPGKTDATTVSAGLGCAARIIENGWKMDY